MRIILAATVLGLSASAIACSGDDPGSTRTGFGSNAPGGHNAATGAEDGGTTQTGVGADDGGTTPVDPDAEAPPDPGACNYQDNLGMPVTVANSSGSMPTGIGGAEPLDGEYELTAATHYGGGGGTTSYKATVYLSGGTHQYAIAKNGGADSHTTVSVEYEPNGQLTWTGKCGSTDVLTLSYTAPTETSLIVYDTTSNTAFTYTRPDPPDTQ